MRLLEIQRTKSDQALEGFFALLRSHEGDPKSGLFTGRMKNLCIHPGIYPKTATAGSFVVEYLSGGILIWFTNSPFPCVSLYKPAISKMEVL